MQQALFSIVIIVVLLVGGWLSGKCLTSTLRHCFTRYLSSVVWLLLFCMGIDFSAVFSDMQVGGGW